MRACRYENRSALKAVGAGWFLQVTDEFGEFFRTPVGHPALDLVEPNDPKTVGRGGRRL